MTGCLCPFSSRLADFFPSPILRDNLFFFRIFKRQFFLDAGGMPSIGVIHACNTCLPRYCDCDEVSFLHAPWAVSAAGKIKNCKISSKISKKRKFKKFFACSAHRHHRILFPYKNLSTRSKACVCAFNIYLFMPIR